MEIEKNIPIPDKANLNGVAAALSKMIPGDSIVIPMNARQGAFATSKRLGKKIVSRKIDNLTTRVWVV